MAEDEPELPHDDEEAAPAALPLWKKVVVGLSILSVLFGFGLQAMADDAPPSSPPPGSALTDGGSTILPTTFPRAEQEEPTATATASEYSPFFVKGGFSFFVGFCIGYALRAFFKISAVALGVVFLVIFGLQQLGVVDVDWDTAGELYDSALAKLSDEFQSFKGFITGSLPSAALAGLGLYTGFKRTR